MIGQQLELELKTISWFIKKELSLSLLIQIHIILQNK